MTSKQKIAIVIVLLLAGLAVYKREDLMLVLGMTPKASNTLAANSASTTGNAINSTINRAQVLKYGDTGANVKELQTKLNTKLRSLTNQPFDALVTDGVFGKKTEAMLKHYTQKTSISLQQLDIALTTKA